MASITDNRILCLMVGKWIVQFHFTKFAVRCYNLQESL
jgi:hypothetical protein